MHRPLQPSSSSSSLTGGPIRVPKEPKVVSKSIPASNSDARLLDAAQTLVRLQQTAAGAERKSAGLASSSEAALALLTSLASPTSIMSPPSPAVIPPNSEHNIMPPPPPSNARGGRGRGAKATARGRGRGRGRGAASAHQMGGEPASEARGPEDLSSPKADELAAGLGDDAKIGVKEISLLQEGGGPDDKPAAPAESSTFTIGNMTVSNAIMDDLLNARKLELLRDPEINALLNYAMSKKKPK